jgi:hypothetical protein
MEGIPNAEKGFRLLFTPTPWSSIIGFITIALHLCSHLAILDLRPRLSSHRNKVNPACSESCSLNRAFKEPS